MRRSTFFATLASAVSALFPLTAHADEPRFPVQMAGCSSEVTLVAPAAFAGATPDPAILAAVDSWGESGIEYRLALTAPAQPSLVLMIAEFSKSSGVPGSITAEQFDAIKAQFVTRDLAGVRVEESEALARMGFAINELTAVKTASDATSATSTMIMKGSAPGSDFQSIVSVKMAHVEKCLVLAMLMAPPSITSSTDVDRTAQSVSFE
jgi:hypothetical protein